MAELRINRDSGYADRLRKYRIICNGDVVGEIANGETLDLELSPGETEVYLKIDWARSNKLTLNLQEGSTTVLQGGSSLRGIQLVFALFYILFLPHKYLWLRQES